MNNQQATAIFKIIRKNVNNMFDEVEAELKNQQRIETLANDDDYKMRGIDVQNNLKDYETDLDAILKMKDINDVLNYLFNDKK